MSARPDITQDRIGVHPVDWPDLSIPEGLDEGIKLAVTVLIAGGVETFQSCQGGPGHAYAEPTVEFHGRPEEGLRAVAWALSFGLKVHELRRVWSYHGGELNGPHWAMTFWPRPTASEARTMADLEARVTNLEDRSRAARLRLREAV